METWEYCELDFDGSITRAYYYDEAGDYIDNPIQHARLGVLLAKLGHDGWELVSTWWRSNKEVTYMLKRRCREEWKDQDRTNAYEKYRKNHPKDRTFS